MGSIDWDAPKPKDFAEGWTPEAGDVLEGTVVVIEDSPEGEYGTHPIVTVEKADGSELAFHAYHAVAKRAIARQHPNVGDTIGIKYLGREVSEKSGNEFANYDIRVSRNSAPAPVAEAGPATADDDDIQF